MHKISRKNRTMITITLLLIAFQLLGDRVPSIIYYSGTVLLLVSLIFLLFYKKDNNEEL